MMLALVIALFLAGAGWAAPPLMMDTPLAGRTQVTCPVRHGKISKDLYVD